MFLLKFNKLNKAIMKAQKPKSPVKDGVTERYDELYPVNLLTYGEDNNYLYYDKDDDSYYTDLKASISEYGLKTPILVYSTDEVKSGNTRLKACIELGYEYIPIVRSILNKPSDKFSNLMALQMENQTRPTNLRRQYNQIYKTILAYQEVNNKTCSANIIEKEICPAAQMSYNQYKNLSTLESTRPDLFQRVIESNGSKLSPGKAIDLMKQDLLKSKQLNISKALENAVTREDVTYAVNAVSNALNTMFGVKINGRNGNQINAFDNIQQNTIGGLVHEVFTNAIAHSINHRANKPDEVTAFPPKKHNDEDIQFPMHNGGIEVKTCLIKDGNKIKYVCKNPKDGYFLFAAFTPEYDRCYVSYGKTSGDIWNKAGAAYANIDMHKLVNSNLDTFFGQLKIEKDKVVVYTDKLGII
jgi:hypothetical protein